MILKRDHLVSWRINWQSKSENIRSLARDLNLGLDSFIFLDDNPVECAEVRAGCPEVLTLRLPIDGNIEEFLRHVWAFDRLRVTSEDRHRTTMYKQEADRARFQREVPTIGDFLAGLDLRIGFSKPAPEQVDRIAQLTHRTNQFNFTTVRRNDGEIHRLAESGLECRAVEVKDRFGDYGLVGVMIFGSRGRCTGGRHIPAELSGTGPGRRARDAQRARRDRPAAGTCRWLPRTLIAHPEESAGAGLPREGRRIVPPSG